MRLRLQQRVRDHLNILIYRITGVTFDGRYHYLTGR